MHYLYVDGESHFIRSRECWKKLHGTDAELEEATCNTVVTGGLLSGRQNLAVNYKSKFFWAPIIASYSWTYESFNISRAVYFTSFSGMPDELHRVKVEIRESGFEPYVIPESSKLAKQRESTLQLAGVIEKAKGVDIALSVRMLEDAYRDNYRLCILLTSDIDFLPVIEAVRRMGKQVVVMGYKDGLSANSPFLFVPDRFVDLGDHFMKHGLGYKKMEPAASHKQREQKGSS